MNSIHDRTTVTMASIPSQTISLALTTLMLALAGCNQDSSGNGGASGSSTGSAASAATSAAQGTVNRNAPTIAGNPSGFAAIGATYSFKPTTTDPSGGTLSFTVKNLPAWAGFDSTSGTISGVPSAANIGTNQGISISVSDGIASASFPAFAIAVGRAAGSAAETTISGTPLPTVFAGAAYLFRPAATDATGAKLTFAIQNLPKWASFDASTGTLSGVPTTADVGAYSKIEITVSDGVNTAALAPFGINVAAPAPGNVTLSWLPPTQNTNGTTADLAGYHIYYGASAKSMTKVINVTTLDTSYVFNELASGNWFFAIAAYTAADVESNLSEVVSVEL
jgi:hypothetical protein